MRQEFESYLAEVLANARAMKGVAHFEQVRAVILHSFSGSLGSLCSVDEITVDEGRDWMERMEIALGVTEQPGVEPFVATAHDAFRTILSDWGRERQPHFVWSIPAPDDEYDLYGGLLRIEELKAYATWVPPHSTVHTMVSIPWCVEPLPDGNQSPLLST